MGSNLVLLLDEKFYHAAKTLIESAQKEILVSSFKFELPSSVSGRSIASLFNVLCIAAQTGRTVKVLVNMIPGRSQLVAINRAAIKSLRQAGCQVRCLPGNRVVHAKLLIVDGKKMILGSHNWSAKSLTNNFEMSLLVDDPETVALARVIFFHLWDGGQAF